MKRVFVETQYEGKLELSGEVIQRLPKRLALAMPVQFLPFQEEIKKKLEAMGKKVLLFKSKHGFHLGQVLGCDIFFFPGEYDAFLYLGDGKFHPTALLYENEKEVYCYNPFTHKLEVYDQKYLGRVLQQRKGQKAKFLSSEVVGMLVTTKPGQNHSKEVEKLREKLEKSGKKVFVFLADEINFSSLENFNFIEVWINTACPRIIEDFRCLNFLDLKELGF
jgi:2-(3-amino-3-carboxypropyl)histidine synthase